VSDPTILDQRLARRRRDRMVRGAFVVLVGCILAAAAALRSDPTRTLAAVDPENLGVGPRVPELAATGWLNSPPLTSRELSGKVVLYDFWTYSCVSCLRTFGHLRAWHERYRSDGLEVIGVHSPRFGFEQDAAGVAAAVETLGVTWPVALDEEGNIADAFRNRGWPTRFVTDRDGALRYVHPGEGRYDETEAVLRELLGVADGARHAGRPAAAAGVTEPGKGITDEVLLGRGVEGRALEPGQPVEVPYRAREVNLVAGAGQGPVEVDVELDGFPIPEALRTGGIEVDGTGRTSVRISAPGLYRLVLGPRVSRHVLRLEARQPGLEVYAVSFG
jgi:thiol-disulfide isomerase/thioredoxin